MKWIYLLIAGALEITWAVAMKMSTGFTILIPSMFGVLLFHEKLSVPQVICVILIVMDYYLLGMVIIWNFHQKTGEFGDITLF